jgi:hypothetical protein
LEIAKYFGDALSINIRIINGVSFISLTHSKEGWDTLGTGAHTCNPSYSGGRYIESWFEAMMGKKLARPHCNTETRCDRTCVIPTVMGGIGRRISVHSWPQVKARTNEPTQK